MNIVKLPELLQRRGGVAGSTLIFRWSGSQMDDPVLNDGLLIFGLLIIVLAPMALALAYTGPGGAGWKLLTFLCCVFAWWYLCFGSSLVIAFVAWVLAWACAMMAFRVPFLNRRHV